MATQKESVWVILSGLGGLATIAYVLHTWPSHSPSPSVGLSAQEQSRSHSQVTEIANTTKDANDGKDVKVDFGAESPGPEPGQKLDRQVPVLHPPRSARTAPELPTEFTLSEGEQKVLLAGQASVGIQFNQIGEEQFLTLRINSSEGSENHAILGTGGRFRFQHDGSEYYVTVLRFDYTARTAALRVDRVAQHE